MTNKPRGTLYIGVTSDLIRRVYEHKSGVHDGFTKKYKLRMLVYFEPHDDILFAIQREKTLKHWINEWKMALVEGRNPEWRDLYSELL